MLLNATCSNEIFRGDEKDNKSAGSASEQSVSIVLSAIMPLVSRDFGQKVFEKITTAVSTFLLIGLFSILQYIFDMEFGCSCRPGLHLNGVLYLVAPPLILTFVVNLTEPFHRKKTFSSQRLFYCNRYNNCCTNVCKLLVKYISIGVVWVATVLFDGDWYFCLRTNFNVSQTGIPCKKNLTYEEELIKKAYKTDSLDFGFYVICGFLCLWSLIEMRRV
ncbi:uncharacterized protein si:dkeyp-122a9.2 [Toxotes jaculatrix]|uniref:uncharacterized protein si:dkeyp-122a9.2 n=1 Tax=Toxotes jaculatrix TaxID=941984 RepID=UPI001B3AFADA|nr:uncharacterized protein si:dkeyp-122a9.2 [Toxotes jaculatrix]